jgi:anaerobic nitric oxide reductase transcription regulator
MDTLDSFVAIAADLTTALSAKDRYQRLLESLNHIIPYDAAALLLVEGEGLIPVATRGLTVGAMAHRFACKDHPRLNIICQSKEPVLFESDSSLPDPFDGLLENKNLVFQKIHSCLGCPLISKNKLVGVLTADAVEPHVFDEIDQKLLTAVASLAAAQLQTANLIETLELNVKRQGQVSNDLMRENQLQKGNEIIGNSRLIEHLKQEINLVGESNFNILVLGETGVGKELVVRAIHAASKRKEGPMLYLNCAAIPESLAESELFGHTKGAFTGADRDRAGKFEVADGGTLFLDEIGELPITVQTKLLRVIQEGEVQRIGSDRTLRVDVRILAATNRDLWLEVKNGKFRADLFHRLDVYPLKVPTLRERPEDIRELADHFCERTRRSLGIGPVTLTGKTLQSLENYLWPGNVRELENLVSRSILKASARVHKGDPVYVRPEHLGDDVVRNIETELTLNHEPESLLQNRASLREATREYQRT